jgi:hypothetical protein
MHLRIGRPSPALVVAVLALFVALSGTAVAAGVVPLAKRALSADNAKKLQGKTWIQVAAAGAAAGAEASSKIPGPASTAAGLIDVHTGPFSLAAATQTTTPNQEFTLACAAGEKVITGGYSSPQDVQGADTQISSDGGSFSQLIINFDSNPATGTMYVVCLK